MSDRLSISGGTFEEEARSDELPLRLATELSSSTSSSATESRRSIFRLEYKLLSAIYDQAGQQLNLAEQVRQLELSVAELQAATESNSRPTTPAAPPADHAPAPLPVAKDVGAPQTLHRIQPEPSGSTSWWIALTALLGVIAILVWALRRHSRKATHTPRSQLPESEPPEEALPWAISDAPPLATGAMDEPPSHETHLLDDSEKLQQNPPTRPPVLDTPHTHGSTVLTEQYDFNPVMELADIMLSFGRVKGATDALLEYIEASPNEALQPWMKLLDIYRQGGMRQDYDSLSQKLKLHFNVAPADWETTADLTYQQTPLGDEQTASFESLLSRLPNIEQTPHVRDEIARTWGTAEGFAYLNKLLRDNRKGERRGFPLSMVSELLFLMDTLERHLNNAKPGEQGA